MLLTVVSVSTSPSAVPENGLERATGSGHTKGKSEMYMSSRDWLKVFYSNCCYPTGGLLCKSDWGVIIRNFERTPKGTRMLISGRGT